MNKSDEHSSFFPVDACQHFLTLVETISLEWCFYYRKAGQLKLIILCIKPVVHDWCPRSGKVVWEVSRIGGWGFGTLLWNVQQKVESNAVMECVRVFNLFALSGRC